jgi:hypothetical protein
MFLRYWCVVDLAIGVVGAFEGLPHHLGDVGLDQRHHGGVGLHINENRRRWIIKANN